MVKGLGRLYSKKTGTSSPGNGAGAQILGPFQRKLDLPGKPTIDRFIGSLLNPSLTKAEQLIFYLKKSQTLFSRNDGEEVLRAFIQKAEPLTNHENALTATTAKETVFHLQEEMRGILGDTYVEDLKTAAKRGTPLAQARLETWGIEWEEAQIGVEIWKTEPRTITAGQKLKLRLAAREGSDFRNVNACTVAEGEDDKSVQVGDLVAITESYGQDAEIEFKVEAHAPAGTYRIDLFVDAEKTRKIGYFTIEIEACKDHYFTVIKGKDKKSYVMQGKLGEGGMGTVYLVKDLDGNRYIAKLPLRTGQKQIARFQREIVNLANVNKRNIPHVMGYYGRGEIEGITDEEENFIGFYRPGESEALAGKKEAIPFFIAEFIEKDVKQRIREISQKLVESSEKGEIRQRLFFEQVLDISKQISECLRESYNQCNKLVHRDLDPMNIRVAVVNDGSLCGKSLVKLADFGQGRQMGEKTEEASAKKDSSTAEQRVDTITLDTQFVGKHRWTAYDVAEVGSWIAYENKGIDPVFGDIYVLGLIIYYMLSAAKRPPFTVKKFPEYQEGMSDREWAEEWLRWLAEFKLKLMDMDLKKDEVLKAVVPKAVLDDVIDLLAHTITLTHETRYRYSKIDEILERISLKLEGSKPASLGVKEIAKKVGSDEIEEVDLSMIIDVTTDLDSLAANEEDISGLRTIITQMERKRDALPDEHRDQKAAYQDELDAAKRRLAELEQDYIPPDQAQAEAERLANIKAEEYPQTPEGIQKAKADLIQVRRLISSKASDDPLLLELQVIEVSIYARIATLQNQPVSVDELMELQGRLSQAEEQMLVLDEERQAAVTHQVEFSKEMLSHLQTRQGIQTEFKGYAFIKGQEGTINLIEKGIVGETLKGIEKLNQDGIAVAERDGKLLYIVADGVGGFAKGELASGEAILVAAKTWQQGNSPEAALAAARSQIKQHIPRRDTCISLVEISGNRARIISSGDMRTYLIKGDGEHILLSYGQNKVSADIAHKHGLATPLWGDDLKKLQEAYFQDAEKNVVTATLGSSDEKNKAPQAMEFLLQEGDQLLTLSDGAYGIIPQFDETLGEITMTTKNLLERKKRLIEAALAAMSKDNKDHVSLMLFESGDKTDPISFIDPSMLERDPELVLLAIQGILAETIDILSKEQAQELSETLQSLYNDLSKKNEKDLSEIEREIKLQAIDLASEIDEELKKPEGV